MNDEKEDYSPILSESGTYLEGVGDDVVVAFFMVAVIVVSTVFVLYK